MRISDWSSDVCSSDLRMRRRWDQPSAVSAATADGGAATAQPDRRGGGCRGKAWPRGVEVENDMGRLVEIGRASCRERVCQYVLISVVAVYLTQKTTQTTPTPHNPSTPPHQPHH